MSEQAADVMKRENRRYSVVNEVAKALDEVAALEREARAEAEKIIAEAEAKAAQIVADALNEAKAMTDEVKERLAAIEYVVPQDVIEDSAIHPGCSIDYGVLKQLADEVEIDSHPISDPE